MDITDGKITLNRELSDLDTFTLDFVKQLRKHTSYVLVSGYVSILLGRSRASEDVDVLIPEITIEKLRLLLADLTQFECINVTNAEEMLSYLNEGLSIRFARKGEVIPNMEVKIARTLVEKQALVKKIPVSIEQGVLYISPLELQVAYKEKVLQSPKDMEDARHLRLIADLNETKIEGWKGLL